MLQRRGLKEVLVWLGMATTWLIFGAIQKITLLLKFVMENMFKNGSLRASMGIRMQEIEIGVGTFYEVYMMMVNYHRSYVGTSTKFFTLMRKWVEFLKMKILERLWWIVN